MPVLANRGFKDFYRDMFEPQVKKAERRAEFTESAWDMNWCDPDAAYPLFFEGLRSLGVSGVNRTPPDFIPGRGRRPIMPPMGGARDVFARPMKVPNDDQHFPEEMTMDTTDAGNGKRWQHSRPVYPAAA